MSRPFVDTPQGDRPAELGYCADCGQHYWTDWGHVDCPVRKHDQHGIWLLISAGCVVWLVLVIAGLKR